MKLQFVSLIFTSILSLPLLWAEVNPVNAEHQALDSSYRDRLASNDESYQANTEKLANSYVGALERLRLELERRGIKPVAESVQAEITRIGNGDVSGYPEGAFLPDKVRDLRAAFDQYHQKLARDAGNADAVALFQYDTQLATLSNTIKADGDEVAYRSLLEFRQELLEPVQAPAVEDTPAEPEPPTTSAGVKNPKQAARRKKRGKFRRPVTPQQPQNVSREDMARLVASLPRPMNKTEFAEHSASMGTRPVASSNGTYATLISSMGSVNELAPDKITAWGSPQAELMAGVGYWTVTVNYQVQTIFGMMDTRGKALVRGGKVAHWIYAGSGEQIH